MRKGFLIASLVLLVLTVGMWVVSCFYDMGLSYDGDNWMCAVQGYRGTVNVVYLDDLAPARPERGLTGWWEKLVVGPFPRVVDVAGTWTAGIWYWSEYKPPSQGRRYGVGLHYAYLAALFSIYPAICLRRWRKQRGGEGEGDAEEAQA